MADLSLTRFNPFYGWMDESTHLWGRDVKLTVHHAGEDPETATERARVTLAWVDANRDLIVGFCADKLLESKNSDWSDDEHPPVDRARFEETLRLEAVDLREDRRTTLRVTAGDLFWGHWIVVVVAPERNLADAYLEG